MRTNFARFKVPREVLVFDADAMRNGRLQLDQLLRRGPWCDYPTVERSPRDTSHRPLQEDGSCSTSLKTYAQRGAQFAPRPRP